MDKFVRRQNIEHYRKLLERPDHFESYPAVVARLVPATPNFGHGVAAMTCGGATAKQSGCRDKRQRGYVSVWPRTALESRWKRLQAVEPPSWQPPASRLVIVLTPRPDCAIAEAAAGMAVGLDVKNTIHYGAG
jgi:hypothetical protein